MVQQIDIEINDYSEKLGLSDVERTIKSAVNSFPNLSSEIDKLSIFVFNSKQIQERIDKEKMRFHTGLTFRSEPILDLMYSYRNKNTGLIKVGIEKFMNSSNTRRRFVARHELGPIFLSGLSTEVTLKDVKISTHLVPTIKEHLNWVLEMWKGFKVDSLMMKLFPELTIKCMHENPKQFSTLRNKNKSSRYRTHFERLLASIKLELTCEMELVVLSKAPSSLKKKPWKSIEKLHLEIMECLRGRLFKFSPT